MKNMMERLRQWVSATSIRFVSAPYLPSGLIWTALLLAYTDLGILLLGQPAGYWIDRSRAASSLPFLENLLMAGIVPYVLAGIVYLIVLGGVLTVLTRSWALVVWMVLTFVHLVHALAWVAGKAAPVQGSGMSAILDSGIHAVSALLLGIILTRVLLNPRQSAALEQPRRGWMRPLALSGWVIVLGALVAISAISPRGGWAPLHPEHTPGRRANSAVTYDPARQRIVLFGGISDWLGSDFFYENDTWEWDGQDWVEMKPATRPPARLGHMMAYDEKRGVVVMFGGQQKTGTYPLADTWVWDGKDWTQMLPANYPAARRGGQMFYDHQSEKIILSGGYYLVGPDKVYTPVNDTWEWDGENWQYVASIPGGLSITNPNVAYDARQERTILYNYKQVLAWGEGQWQALDAGPQTPARFGTWLVASPETGQMLVFGGVENNIQLNDTWLLEGNTWKELHPDLTPTPRDAHIMFYDPNRRSFILYGGVSGYALDDMWEYVLPWDSKP